MEAASTVEGDVLDEGVVVWVSVESEEDEVAEGGKFRVGVE